MSSSGLLQRPFAAMAAVAASAVSANLPDKLSAPKSMDSGIFSEKSNTDTNAMVQESKSWVSQISVPKLTDLSLVTRFRIPVPNVNNLAANSSFSSSQCSLSFGSPSVLKSLYQSADIAKQSKPSEFRQSTLSSPPSEVMYRWHYPDRKRCKDTEESDCSSAKSRTVVVLLGWLGAKQKHLQRYADWYTSRGFHAITFTFPMSEILSYKVGGKAEQHIDLLVNHLAGWLEEENGKNLVFHTFSNTGWLTYGAILEKFQEQDESLVGRIKGCVVDSAPVATPDSRVWASGFSTALLKKQSVGTKGSVELSRSDMEVAVGAIVKAKPAVTETALLVILEKFFDVVLNLPKVNRRLSDVVNVLSTEQPKCPQLYIYSSSDHVIPAESVKSFIEEQRKSGREVRACDFKSTPHVDHYRNEPALYTSQLTNFIEDCVLICCKKSS